MFAWTTATSLAVSYAIVAGTDVRRPCQVGTARLTSRMCSEHLMEQMPISEISAVMFKRGRFWILQCLEFDICVQAQKLQDLQYELGRALIGYEAACNQEKIEAFSNLPRAPQQYWDMWNEAHVKVEFDAPDPFRFPSGAQLPRTALRLAA